MPRVTITVPDTTPQPYRFQLDRRKVTLGRGSDNDIVISDSSVSSKHAEMVRTDNGYEIRDLGSTNGTKLDGQRRMTIPLWSGTTVILGDVAFDFQLSEDEQAELGAQSPIEPLPAEQPVRRRSTMAEAPVAGRSGTAMLLIFLVLAAAAFSIGLAIRHQKETGHSLLSELTGKKPAKKTPAGSEPAPASGETPAAPAEPAPATPAEPTTPAPSEPAK
ncbi:FHA domain-containing protein [Luteolibacter ambystomatis]|uniref:FHA domain-containing protein n=1 Tax=Luteolibacter ambystomatis TaxID=2824561 RepID=A0A975IZL5_9BACT|nr:FHA domain-containing protein [Luteolibacter ambystomatis]QUE51329.1 FHA domain-containing protein [Luteolibacter ambystomatis]